MRLSKKLAQKIVEEMMKVIPYNVNVMNEKGIIIGSGDEKRLGRLHKGAVEAIKKKEMVEIFESGRSTKPGVNEPIIINGEVIGVVGITGDPEKVKPFSELVGVAASLLIEQVSRLKEYREKEKLKEEFLYELAYRKKEYDKDIYSLAESYGIALEQPYQGVILMVRSIQNFQKKLKKVVAPDINYLRLDSQRFVLFLKQDKKADDLIELLREREEIKKIGIGDFSVPFSKSLENANLALDIGEKLKPSNRVYSYNEWEFFVGMRHKFKDKQAELINELEKTGEKLELFKTLKTYIEENGEMNEVARKMNIHRNTLNYRLDKIYETTGKNPKNLLDLMELIAGIVWKE